MRRISRERLTQFLNTASVKHAEEIFKALGTHEPFMDAIQSDIGIEINNLLLTDLNQAFHKIAQMNATEEDKAMYKAITLLANKINKKIIDYNHICDEVDKVALAAEIKE